MLSLDDLCEVEFLYFCFDIWQGDAGNRSGSGMLLIIQVTILRMLDSVIIKGRDVCLELEQREKSKTVVIKRFNFFVSFI
jgi:hypothetical protein